MFNQKSFIEKEPTIVNANEPHMALLLLVDTSSSMTGEPIAELNSGVNRFKREVCEDKLTRSKLDIAVMEFNTTYKIVQPFVPIERMEPVNLIATGGTEMAPAIEEAINIIDERVRFYKRTCEPYKPWIVMISDGYSSGVENVAKRINQLETQGKLKFWSLGVEGYNSDLLHMLSKQVLKLKGYDFRGFFNWLSKSMRSVSESSPGETPGGERLPDSVDKDLKDVTAYMA